MNKRQKRKWSRVERLENKVVMLMAENVLLTEAVKRQNALIEGIHDLNARNIGAINSRFNNLERKVVDKLSKKSWFGRY